MTEPDRRRVDVHFDASTHSADAIQRAAYRLCDRLSVEVTRDGANWLCAVYLADGSLAGPEAVADLRIEVTDQVLRERIRKDTEDTRNIILASAFAGLVKQETD